MPVIDPDGGVNDLFLGQQTLSRVVRAFAA